MQPTPRLRLHLTEFNEFWCLSISTGVIRKYEEKAHTSSLHRDINVCANFLSHGNEREAERARGQGARPPPLGARPGTNTNHRMEYTITKISSS